MSEHDMQDTHSADDAAAPSFDQIQRFLFDATNVRGEIVTLDKAYAEVLDRHSYPQAISRQLGEMLAAVALLTETIKLDGTMTLEVRGTGIVRQLTGGIAGLFKANGVTALEGTGKVTGSQQVMLAVRFAEVARSVIKQLGANSNLLFDNGDVSVFVSFCGG